MLKLINCWILDHVCSFFKNKTFRWFKSVYIKHVRFLQDFIVWPKCLETETTKTEKSRDRIGQTGNGQTEMSCSGVSHTNASTELLKRERFLYLLCTITKLCGPWNICLLSWAQFGGGHGGRVPPLFQMGGHNMPCPPTFFSLGFVFGEVLKIKVMFVTFCVKSFSC